MVKLFLRIYDYMHSHRRLCLGLLTASIALFVIMMSQLNYNENIFDFLPVSGNDQKAMDLYQDISQSKKIIAVFEMKDSTIQDPARLADAVDAFAEQLNTGSGKENIKELTTQVDFDKYAGIADFVYANIPLFLTDSDYERIRQQLSQPDFASEQLAADAELIMMPATGFFTTNISNDPLNLFSPLMQKLQSRQTTMPIEIDNGYIYTPDKRHAIAMMTTPFGSVESANNAMLVGYVDSCAQAVKSQMPDVEVNITGAPAIAVGNASQIKNDSMLAITIAVILIMLLLMFSFRSVKNLLLIVVAIFFGWAFAMGCIAMVRSDVSLIVLGIGSIIIGIAVNYPLHFVAHMEHGGTARDVLRDMVAPLLIGNITTVGAFATLIPLEAQALHDLGLFAAFMLIGTILFVLIFLPHIVRTKATEGKEHLFFGKLAEKNIERQRWLLPLVAVLTVILGYFSFFTSFDANLTHINYMTPEAKRVLSEVQSGAGVTDTATVYLVAEGKSWDEALDNRLRLSAKIQELTDGNQVEQANDFTAFITSQQEQQRRIELWNAFVAEHGHALLAMITKTAPEYGFSDDAFSGFSAILSANYTPHSLDYFEPLTSTVLDNSTTDVNGNCSVIDAMTVGKDQIQQVKDALNAEIGEAGYAFDFESLNSNIASTLSDNFNYIGFACGLIVFVFLWISFGRMELSLLAFLPMALGWIWILGIMYLCDMQFNIVNVILATFIFGQGDDYTIFMTDGLINEYAYRRKLLPSYKNSIVISALIMFIGMGSLIVARHPALHSLAEVTIVGMLTVVLMAWVIPPLVFGWMVRDKHGLRDIPITLGNLCRRASVTAAIEKAKANPSTHALHQYLIYKYMYKGVGIERETRRLLRQHNDFSEWIDNFKASDAENQTVSIVDAGQGQFSLMMALVHPELQVYSYANDADDTELLAAMEPMPANLHVASSGTPTGTVINFNEL